MRRLVPLAGLFFLAAPALASPRPAWVKPNDGVRFFERDAIADRNFPLPAVGESFYLFTRRALTREALQRTSQAGLRYLGIVTTYGYTFLRETESSGQRALLRSLPQAVGTAKVQREDRADEETLPYLRLGAGTLPHPLTVTLWPATKRKELHLLLPEIESGGLRLPKDNEAPIRAENTVILDEAISTADLLGRLVASPLVAAVRFEHKKRELNNASRALSNADALLGQPIGVDGTGVLVGHWDGGSVSSNHPDYGGRVDNMETAGVSSHATHTAGTILGSGSGSASARGYAPGATMIAYDFFGNSSAERREAKHDYYHEHDSHSWGSTSTAFGGYDGLAQQWDLDARDLFLMGIKAAGNEGSQSQVVVNNYGFDSLSPDSTGKNVLIIGATSDDGDLTGFSSRGPTNDGRIKPDLSANGQNLRSTWPGGGYAGSSGTSMSCPSVTGMVTLLAELYKREHSDLRWAPDMTRAVMIHTVRDVFHFGPDYRHGWGNADAEAAANLVLADVQSPGQRLVRGAVRDAESKEYKMEVPAGAPELKVTLSWLDAFSASTAQRRLINNVDLLLISPSGTEAYPWTLDPANPFDDAVRNGPNNTDNVEQVLVEDPEPGEWTIRVVGTQIADPDLTVQGYVFATSHLVQRSLIRVYQDLPQNGLPIPDGDPAGLTLSFDVPDRAPVDSFRVRLDIQHEGRGDLRILIRHPDGTEAVVETEDNSTRRDIFAIYPDTRSYADDVNALFDKPSEGTWEVQIIDVSNGGTGVVRQGVLEIDLDGTPLPPPNMPPAANAGKDDTYNSGDLVVLDGTDSVDPEGEALTYQWTQQSGAQVTLSDPTVVSPEFTAPEVEGTKQLVFRLTVMDPQNAQASDDVTISVVGSEPATPNQPPIARTNGDQTVPPDTLIFLDATASEDPDGDRLAFQWLQIAGAGIAIDGADQSIASLTTPSLSEGTLALVFQVEVTDEQGELDLEEVLITVAVDAPPPPPPPVSPPPPEIPEGPGAGLTRGGIDSTCGCTAAEQPGFGGWSMFLVAGLSLALVLRRRR